MLKPRKILAAHPGQILQMLLAENDITQTTLAAHLQMPQTKISEICCGKRGVSAEMAMKLAKALGMSANIWMNLQRNWELSRIDEKKIARVRRIRVLEFDEEKLAA